jgi:hypothetical protein
VTEHEYSEAPLRCATHTNPHGCRLGLFTYSPESPQRVKEDRNRVLRHARPTIPRHRKRKARTKTQDQPPATTVASLMASVLPRPIPNKNSLKRAKASQAKISAARYIRKPEEHRTVPPHADHRLIINQYRPNQTYSSHRRHEQRFRKR